MNLLSKNESPSLETKVPPGLGSSLAALLAKLPIPTVVMGLRHRFNLCRGQKSVAAQPLTAYRRIFSRVIVTPSWLDVWEADRP